MLTKLKEKMLKILLLTVGLMMSGCALNTKLNQDGTPTKFAYVEGDAAYPAILTATPSKKKFNYVEGDATYPAVLTLLGSEFYDVSAPEELDNIWDRIRTGFVLPNQTHPRIESQMSWFVHNPDYLARVAERAQPYMHYIVETLEENDIPSELALLPIVESAFKPFAYSHGRASGIWQFIPSTGRLFGLEQNWWYDGRRDVYAATQAAVKLLKNLGNQFNGDWMLALAAYNSGAGTVMKAVNHNKRRGKPTDFWSLDLPVETRAYVPKLLALKEIVSNPEKYGISLPRIANEPYFDVVDVNSQIDLALAAELADLDLEQLYELNPGYNRWATAPKGPHYLLLPVDKADTFSERLAQLPEDERIRWKRHTIHKGETISSIADKYNVSIQTIKRLNHMRSNFLRVGHSLTIPVASESPRSYTLSASQRLQTIQNIPRKGGVKVVHIVRSGDTLWDLARDHHVGVRQLASWNGMAPRDRLTLGQRLVIWSRIGKASSSNDLDDVNLPERRSLTARIGYRVRNGDSLARISQRFKVSISQLCTWNKITQGQYLRPGQRLTLYVDVMRQSGG